MTVHRYDAALAWSGSTRDYAAYDRNHRVMVAGHRLDLSADPAFRGDPAHLNPEQLLVAAASSCQLLSFLAVAARSGVEVLEYADEAVGTMPEDERPVRISAITLRPRVRVRGASPDRVRRLLEKAHRECYIANSLSTEITVEATIEVA